ncbi:lysostaphin resistance A-like protein [Microlunatus sp. Y2014]|uniref:CPBP family intramembrane glutamic endopeptidase n=1 Tax=Microlunatus sp. Y2014 TaxID=3418488 RepID=UPI003DA785A1
MTQQPAQPPQPTPPTQATQPTRPGPPAKPKRQVHAPGLPYHQALRTPGTQWWRGALALLVFVVAGLIINTIFGVIAIAIDVGTGRVPAEQAGMVNTPVLLGLGSISLALLWPLAALVQWAFFGQRPRWINSVEGKFRWGWFLRVNLVLIPVMIVYLVITSLPVLQDPQPGQDWLWFLLIGLLITPFQAAGEEYGFRGLINRATATWSSNRWVAFAIGAVISGVLFTIAHAATDPWLNAYYFSFGAILCAVVWLTGGIEAAVAMHVVNNVVAIVLSSLTADLGGMFDRSAGTGGPFMLIQIGVMAILGAVMVLWARRRKLQALTTDGPTPAAPGQAQPTPVEGQAPNLR